MRNNKFTRIFSGFALTALIGAGFSSCSNELNEPTLDNTSSNLLVKAPKVVAYSGGKFWNQYASTRSSSLLADGQVLSFKAVEGLIDREKEQKLIEDFLPEENLNLGAGIDEHFLYYAKDADVTFELYPLISHTSYNPNYLGIFYYDEADQRHEEIVWEAFNPYDLTRTDYSVYPAVTYSKGVEITVRKGYKFGFFWGGRYYPVDGNGWNDKETRFYSIPQLNEESYVYENGNVNKDHTSRVHAITFRLEGKTYLGLEDWADFDFQDLVFGSTVSLPTVDEEDRLPDTEDTVTPEVPETPDVNPDVPETPDVTPDNPGDNDEDNEGSIGDVVKKGFDEVEINLALDAKDNGDFSSHLSMHVRHATDVEVFIPVPAKYYCDADDMAIVMDKVDEIVHGGPYVTEFFVGDNRVTLNIEFKENGIRIFTDGINEAVIAYCREKYNDGITFEVWNYFNDPDKVEGLPITIEELKTYLDRATVTFLDDVPDTYINAFGKENGKYGEGGSREGNDFHVTPASQKERFEEPVEGTHLNGSEINEIYVNKDSDNK